MFVSGKTLWQVLCLNWRSVTISLMILPFEQVGQGRTLVLLHAFPLSRAMWQPQITEFKSNFQVVAPDLLVNSTSIDQMAQNVAALLDELKIQAPIALCGLSLGGYVALSFVRQFPEKLGALILSDTKAAADDESARQNREKMIEVAKERGAAGVIEKMLPNLLGETTRRDKPHLIKTVREIAENHSTETLVHAIRALRDRRDSTSVLPQISCPTLAIGGAEDEISSPDVMAKMAAHIPGARHQTLEGAGHLSSLETPEQWNQKVWEFLCEN